METQLDCLLAWAMEHGAILEGIEFRKTERAFSAFATRDFAARERMLIIPDALSISPNQSKYYEDLMRLHKLDIESLSDKQMMCFILCVEQRDPNSFYRPYFDSIPRESMVNDITTVDSNLIPDTPGARQACSTYRGIKLREIDDLVAFGAPLNFTREEVHWVVSLVYARGFVNPELVSCMNPVLDLVQCSVTHPDERKGGIALMETKWFSNVAALVSASPVKKGDELQLDYSQFKFPNLMMFCQYGYTSPRNMHDRDLTLYRAEIISALCEVIKGPLKKKQFREAVKSVQDRFVPIRDNKISKEMTELVENCVNGSRGIHGQVIVKIFDVLKAAREEKLRAVHPEFKFIYEDEIRLLSEVFKSRPVLKEVAVTSV